MRNYVASATPKRLTGVEYPATRSSLTEETLRSLLHYDPVTGNFTRLVAYGRWKLGEIAGTVKPNKDKFYVHIKIGRFIYGAHRLAWFYVYGVWPTSEIDHRDGDGTHNNWLNLRDVTSRVNKENLQRAPKNKKYSPLLGAHWCKKRKRWKSSIGVNGKAVYIGWFDTDVKASAAYLAKKRELHEGCTI